MTDHHRFLSSCYSPRVPLPVLAFRNNHEDALPVQPGKVIEVWDLVEDERFLLVSVDGQEFHAFTSDVYEFCDRLSNRLVKPLLAAAVAA
jgi:hypothetical protein